MKWLRRKREPSQQSGSEEQPRNPQETLEERLRHLDWPKPPEGVKERMLEDLLTRLEESKGGDSGGQNEADDRKR